MAKSASAVELRVVVFGKSLNDKTKLHQLLSETSGLHSQKPAGRRNPVVVKAGNIFRLKPNIVKHEMKICIQQCFPGPNILLFLVKPSEFNESDRQKIMLAISFFGPNACNCSMVVLTQSEGEENSSLRSLIQDCCQRQYSISLDERDLADYDLRELLWKMESIVSENNEVYLNNNEDANSAVANEYTNDTLNLALCGRHNALKTSVANFLLGENRFNAQVDSSECVRGESEVFGQRVSLVRLPVLAEKPTEDAKEQSYDCLSLCNSGHVDAFILVIPLDNPSQNDKKELETIQDVFGWRVDDLILVLFVTRANLSAVTRLLNNKDIQDLQHKYRERCLFCDITDHEQVLEVLEAVNKLRVARRGFTSSMIPKLVKRNSTLKQERSQHFGGEEFKRLEKSRLSLRGTESIMWHASFAPREANIARTKGFEDRRETFWTNQKNPQNVGKCIGTDYYKGNPKTQKTDKQSSIFEFLPATSSDSKNPGTILKSKTVEIVPGKGRIKTRSNTDSDTERTGTESEDFPKFSSPKPGRQNYYANTSWMNANSAHSMVNTRTETTEIEELVGKVNCRNELRLLLVGKTGSGKSASGSTILGQERFKSAVSPKSVTKCCCKETAEIDGRTVAVVDTPGLFDTSLSNDQVKQELVKCVSLLAPGPHVFLLVLEINRFTKEQKDTVRHIENFFGKNSKDYTIILFTNGDCLRGKTIESYIAEDTEGDIKKLVSECGERYHVFNNSDMKNRSQVTQLLTKVESLVSKNNGDYYTSTMFREAEAAIQKETTIYMKKLEPRIELEQRELWRQHQQEVQLQKEKIAKLNSDFEEKTFRDRLKKENDERIKSETLRMKIKQKEREKEEGIVKSNEQFTRTDWRKILEETEQRKLEEQLLIKKLIEEHAKKLEMFEKKRKADIERIIEEEEKSWELGKEALNLELQEIRRRHEIEARRQAEEDNDFRRRFILAATVQMAKKESEVHCLKQKGQAERENILKLLCHDRKHEKDFGKLRLEQVQELDRLQRTHFECEDDRNREIEELQKAHKVQIDQWIQKRVEKATQNKVCSIL